MAGTKQRKSEEPSISDKDEDEDESLPIFIIEYDPDEDIIAYLDSLKLDDDYELPDLTDLTGIEGLRI